MQTTRLVLVAGLAVAMGGSFIAAQDATPPGGGSAGAGGAAGAGGGSRPSEPPEFPAFADVSKGFERVNTGDGSSSLYTLWRREKDGRVLAELSRNYESQRLFVAMTYAGGVPSTGIQLGDIYCYWRRYDKRLALLEVNTEQRATGDAESKRTEEKLYTDRVVVDVPIVAMGPGGAPVIDVTGLLVGQVDRFFGFGAQGNRRDLFKLTKLKPFPQNIEIAYEMPARDGRLQTLHYSISVIPERGSYQPREADQRVGYFTVAFRDISQQGKETQWVRYITRWNLEKRDPKLAVSPPKQPIVFYIDANTPVQYRRWVREGVLEWNKAYEKVGIVDAIEVLQQDATTGAHMDKDPEDVRYNFIRWTSSDMGFAIGPSRAHPETGQILDADVVIDDGFLRGWFRQYQQLLPEITMLGMNSEQVAWLDRHPKWDPRVRLAPASERDGIVEQRETLRTMAHQDLAGQTRQAAIESNGLPVMGLRSGAPLAFGSVGLDPTGWGLANPTTTGAMRARMACTAMLGRAMDMELLRMGYEELMLLAGDEPPAAGGGEEKKDGEKKDEKSADRKKKEQMLDGLPESFVGPLLKDLVSHEVGHTLGLRHNFKASTWKTIKEMNDPATKGKEPIVASVMDYTPLNVNFNDGVVQGDYGPIGIGPYDFWAIEYGYGDAKDLKGTLARAGEKGLAFGTDEDVGGPDPVIKLFDLGSDSLAYADSTMRLVQELRGKILPKLVKDGESFARVRQAYELLLGRHVSAVRIATYYLGGVDVNRLRKGDKLADGTSATPLTPVDAGVQRKALAFAIDNAFKDEAFGLSRDLLEKMTVDKWGDGGGFGTYFADPAYQVHDRILGVQSSVLMMLMNPVTLQRVFDNEYRKSPSVDALTLPEMLDTLVAGIWGELDNLKDGTVREPSISSLRRNLQREFLSMAVDVTLPDASWMAAYNPVRNLTVAKLRELKIKIDRGLNNGGLDAYTKAHLAECSVRIGKALDATYIYNNR